MSMRATAICLAAVLLAVLATRVWTQSPEPRVVEVTARRFAFEPAQIDAVVGERLRLVVRSADGVHGIEIRTFRVNKEIPRGGRGVVIDFTASEAGRFPILCSEYCGDGHDEMTGVLVVTAASGSVPEGQRDKTDSNR
jgi:cytochrome c oxidase subunit II